MGIWFQDTLTDTQIHACLSTLHHMAWDSAFSQPSASVDSQL